MGQAALARCGVWCGQVAGEQHETWELPLLSIRRCFSWSGWGGHGAQARRPPHLPAPPPQELALGLPRHTCWAGGTQAAKISRSGFFTLFCLRVGGGEAGRWSALCDAEKQPIRLGVTGTSGLQLLRPSWPAARQHQHSAQQQQPATCLPAQPEVSYSPSPPPNRTDGATLSQQCLPPPKTLPTSQYSR